MAGRGQASMPGRGDPAGWDRPQAVAGEQPAAKGGGFRGERVHAERMWTFMYWG
jgi:hypothetical protein